jgi:hypothetical protein
MKRHGRGTAIATAVVAIALVATSVTAAEARRVTTTSYAISVADTAYADYTIAIVTPDEHQDYVFVQCYTPDGTYVYAAWFDVIGTEALIGPLWATTWPAGRADCRATLGYFMRDGWGRWKPLAETGFNVTY